MKMLKKSAEAKRCAHYLFKQKT